MPTSIRHFHLDSTCSGSSTCSTVHVSSNQSPGITFSGIGEIAQYMKIVVVIQNRKSTSKEQM